MFYLIHGDNAFEQEEALAGLLAAHADPLLIETNKEILEPPLTLDKLRQACDTLPFLGDKRIVMVKNALGKGCDIQKIAEYLPTLPPTTLLIFIEHRNLPASHPVYKLCQGEIGKALHFATPNIRALPIWIRDRAKKHGGAIEPAAALLLAQNIGVNLHQLDQELQKLLIYRGDTRPITPKDVEAVVPYLEGADVIFDMVDALGQRKPQIAARHLHRLLDANDKEALSIFGMIVRQYRLLIQTRWMMDRGAAEQAIIARLGLHPYVAQKIQAQAGYFTLPQLHQAYHLLMETDLAIKQGALAQGAALDLLVAQLTRL